MRALARAIVAHFATPRCVYCGTRQDREGRRGCETPHMWSSFHVYPDGPGLMLTGRAPGPYNELADAPDWDD